MTETARDRVFVIAEAGSCHDGEYRLADQLVHAASAAGADAVKFQYWSSARRMAARRNAPDYKAIYERYAMPESWLARLARAAESEGIEFMCSTYLPEDVDTVAPLVKRLKVASFESADIVHLVAHRKAMAAGKHVIVSLGLGHDGQFAMRWLMAGNEFGSNMHLTGGTVSFLHCVSAYPVDASQLRLHWLRRCECSGRHQIRLDGLSDHTAPSQLLTGALAVAAGASIIERHLKLDATDRRNPDAPHAQNQRQFEAYVKNIRLAEAATTNVDTAATEAAMKAYEVR